MPLTFRNGNEADLDVSKLMAAEPAFCTDTKRLYIGNGDGTAYPVMTAGIYSLGTGANNPNTVDHALYADNYPDWMSIPYTCTYASATSFTVPANLTGILSVGDKIRLTQTTVKYFYVTGLSVSNGVTTVTVTGGSDFSLMNAAITSPCFSKIENPTGFPPFFNWNSAYYAIGGSATISNISPAANFWLVGHHAHIKISTSLTISGSIPVGIYVSLPLISGTNYCAMSGYVRVSGVWKSACAGLMDTTDKVAIISPDLQIGNNVIAVSGFYRYA